MKNGGDLSHKKYQPDRPDILWNTDWGRPYESLSTKEATAKELVVYKGRWVTFYEKYHLAQEYSNYCRIKSVSRALVMLGIVGLFLGLNFAVNELLHAMMSNPGKPFLSPKVASILFSMPGLPLIGRGPWFIAIPFGFLLLVAGTGLNRFRSWGWYLALMLVAFGTIYSFMAIPRGDRWWAGLILSLSIAWFLGIGPVRNVFFKRRPPGRGSGHQEDDSTLSDSKLAGSQPTNG